jgi:cation diffusion facilitator family transporter
MNMEVQVREKKAVAAASVAAAVVLTAGKLVVGFLTGSLGILAEAAHSALDLAAAAITFIAVRASDRPADASHLYGHGKIENLSALVQTALLWITCVWIIYEAIQRLFFVPVEVEAGFWAFLVMAVSIVVDYSRSRALSKVAKKYKSQALEADALHFSTDIWSSAVVIFGLALVRFGEYRGSDRIFFRHADAIAALAVAAIVLYVSFRLGRRAVDMLLDRAPSGLADRVSHSVEAVPGIRRVERARVRNAGSQVFVDLKVNVPRHLSFEETHQLTRKAQEAVHGIAPNADVVIHTIPTAERESVLETIHAVAAREHVSIHNVAVHSTEHGVWIDLDLEVDPHLSFEAAHEMATNLETKLRAELAASEDAGPVADINAHIEPLWQDDQIQGQPLEPLEADSYIRKVQEIGRELKGSGGCRKIELHKIDGGVYLSFHLLIKADIPIAEVHGIAEDMENRLRREFPELGRVVIHTEPL